MLIRLFLLSATLNKPAIWCHEHSDEHIANKCICLVNSIQKNLSTVSDNHLAITLVNFFSEKYLFAE